MNFDNLSDADRGVLGQSLRAAADGPFFPDWEFHTLFGLQREQVRAIASEWPDPTAPHDDVVLAVNNSLNMLLSYPHRKHEVWSQWLSVNRRSLNELFNRLRGRENEHPLDRMM